MGNNITGKYKNKGDQEHVIPQAAYLRYPVELLQNSKVNGRAISLPNDPEAGLNIAIPSATLFEGPFCPFVLEADGEDPDTWDDQIVIGVPPGQEDTGEKASRTADTPGVLMIGDVVKLLTQTENEEFTATDINPVSITSNTWEEYPDETAISVYATLYTNLLCLKVNPNVAVTESSFTSYVFIAADNLDTDYTEWEDSSGNKYFPLGWVTIKRDEAIDEEGVDIPDRWVVQKITWPNTAWVLEGGGAENTLFVIQITGAFVDFSLCSVFANGMFDDQGIVQTATLTDQQVYFTNYSNVGGYVPVGATYLAKKVSSHYEAQIPLGI